MTNIMVPSVLFFSLRKAWIRLVKTVQNRRKLLRGFNPSTTICPLSSSPSFFQHVCIPFTPISKQRHAQLTQTCFR
jgi:hypothetical protein